MTTLTSSEAELKLFSYLKENCSVQHNFVKRCFDIVFSLMVLILISPLYLFLAIVVKCSSKGPIFYASKRVGMGGKTIYCWKFRSMFQNADQKLSSLLESNPEMKKEWQENFKLKNDPRITKVGHLLRKTSLDELPQFWNVLKGDLSTVGPRPLSATEVLVVIEKGRSKMFSVRPGLTGIWQTSGRSLVPFEHRIQIEEEYIEKQSFILDLLIILKTIPAMLFPKGAF